MSKSVIAAIVIVVLVLAGGGTYLATRNSNNSTSSNKKTNTSTPMQSMPTNNSTGSESTNPSATSSVTIENFAFSPASITVKKGTTVTWTNKDSAPHTVTEIDGKTGPDSGNMANGKSYSFTYDTVGIFKYHCAIHPNMAAATVTVTE